MILINVVALILKEFDIFYFIESLLLHLGRDNKY